MQNSGVEEPGDFLREYRDEFSIRIELGSIDEREPVEVFEVSHPTSTWSRDHALDRLEALTQDDRIVRAAGLSDSGGSVPFTLDIKRSVTSWGAEAAAEEIILRIAEWTAAGVVGSAAYAAVIDLLRRFGRDTDEVAQPTLFERDEAYGIAEWGVAEKYGLSQPVAYVEDTTHPSGMREVRDDSVELVDEAFDGTRWSFRWRQPPYEYEARVERLEGYATLTFYRRTRIG